MPIAVKPRCASCRSGQTYTLKNGTVVCRLCGHRARKGGRK